MSAPTPDDRAEQAVTVLTPAVLREWRLPEPAAGDGKAGRGTALVVGGSRGTPGAVLLAGVAALRAGAGVLQIGSPASTAIPLGISVPEALVLPLPETAVGSVSSTAVHDLAGVLPDAAAILIGPGLYDDDDEIQALMAALVKQIGSGTTVVVDGHALRGLRPETVAPVSGRLVLTPNTAEAAQLLDAVPDAPDPADDPAGAATAIAHRLDAVVSLHGHIADAGGERWVDQSGHAGLGTSGSGDVLAGLVVGFLARGATPAQAACWATHVHATVGERLGARISHVGFLARELLDEAPLVIAELVG
jgi:ADP-dependent NAD(P)H-hydrate dehydratase